MNVDLISYTPAPLQAIATAAAITQGKTAEAFLAEIDGDRQKLVDYVRRLYEAGHWSVFEFADFDFEVSGVSRVFETQAVRSRMGSYEWESGRHDQEYVASDEAENVGLGKHIECAIQNYADLVECESYEPEEARYALPQGVARKGRIKKNLRAWIETAEQRTCHKAQREYRWFMIFVREKIREVDPFLGSLLVPKCERLGYCPEMKQCTARHLTMPTRADHEAAMRVYVERQVKAMCEAEREKVERELLDAMDVVRLKSDEYCTFFNDDCEGCFLDDSVAGCCLAVKLEGTVRAVRRKLGHGAASGAAQ